MVCPATAKEEDQLSDGSLELRSCVALLMGHGSREASEVSGLIFWKQACWRTSGADLLGSQNVGFWTDQVCMRWEFWGLMDSKLFCMFTFLSFSFSWLSITDSCCYYIGGIVKLHFKFPVSRKVFKYFFSPTKQENNFIFLNWGLLVLV